MPTSDHVLAELKTLHPRLIDLSLGRIERLLGKLGHPERKLPPVIHIAGTNGKGSTLAYLRATLEAAGLRVHAYTSPYLVRINECVRLGSVGGGLRMSLGGVLVLRYDVGKRIENNFTRLQSDFFHQFFFGWDF